MLLDERKTKRRVRIIAVIASLAFVGAIVPVLFVSLFSGSSTDSSVKAALEQTRKTPNDPAAYDGLAIAYASDTPTRESALNAVAAARKALALTPKRDARAQFDRVRTLVANLQTAGQNDQALAAANAFTRAQPKNADAFYLLGQTADQQSRSVLARLSYERFVALDPTSSIAQDVRARIAQLEAAATQTTPAPVTLPSGAATP
ncbi:MAG: tetratricopeptide repeat protein [Actinobacteria bacterium]|nr:tetratricopeptide repeat protein [Actinomycetota bacterium]